jgi:oligopeptide transport system ATP-binding protein
MKQAVLEITGLNVEFSTSDGPVEAVKGMNVRVERGETIAIVGESGSGKSQAMMAVLGLLAANGKASGSVRLDGEEILGLCERQLNRVRGRKITMIFQEPMTSLDPLFPVGAQLVEVLRVHAGLDRKAARLRAVELLRLVEIQEPERRIRSYPHELSGGQRQRIMIAMAICNKPDVIIADEPTTALDVTIQAQILELLAGFQSRFGMAIVFITHNLGIVRRFAGRLYVMRAGEIVESGPTMAVMENPSQSYTQMLIESEPAGHKPPVAIDAPIELSARGLSVTFRTRGGLFKPAHELRAVDGVDLDLRRGETLGIVGESGSGKSTLGRAILRLVPAAGTVLFEDRALDGLSPSALRPLRRSLQIVFQDPFGALSPRMTVGDIVSEGLLVHLPQLTRREREQGAADALREVGIDAAARNRFPHEFSGGQRQRIAIARAMILRPRLVVLDEPTSALDRSIQADILALLRRLQAEHGLTYIFISHDLAVVRAMANRILVMRCGRIVEAGDTARIFEAPQQTYTQQLIAAALLGDIESIGTTRA